MDPGRWKRVREVLEQALALEAVSRAGFLARECAGDTELGREVEQLLAGEARGGRLEPPAAERIALAWGESAPRLAVGDYVLERVLGSGGMGTVYLARREVEGITQRVALKLLRGGLDSAETLRRFKTERVVLAALQHERIARFLDGGTTADGQPWYAMEYVDGRPIDRWCDEQRLGTRARVALFLEVCEAVQHAHGRLVLHRDLKPANILIAGDGHAKLLDFGIAKLLESDGAPETLTGQRALTPAYASPEQLRGEPGTIASDVYSLGVVLYELLAGARPFASPTAAIARRLPERASTAVLRSPPAAGTRDGSPERIARELRGDLDTILLKALHEDASRRYATVEALAEDLRRHLAGRIVLARPDTAGYRVRTFVRRNKLPVALAAAALLVLVAGLAGTLSMYRQSRDNERRAMSGEQLAEERRLVSERSAERERQRADEVLRLSALQRLEDLTADADRLWPAVPENLPRYEQWLEKARELVDELPDHEKKLADLRKKSLPWTEEEQAKHRAEHPKRAQLESTIRHRDHLEKLRAALEAGPPSSDPVPAEVGVDLASLSRVASEVNDLTWPLIDPDRKHWGGEAKGLVLARHAMELAVDLPPFERARIRDSLAWALFANARFEEALAEEEQALAETPPDKQQEFEGYLSKLKAEIEEELDPEKDAEHAKRIAELEERIARLEAEISKRPEWLFADSKDKWWHNQLEKLVSGLKSFADEEVGLLSDGTSPEHGWGIPKRAQFARTVAERSLSGAEGAARWAAAVASIANRSECPLYGGLRIAPQLGLLPIGRDPVSGLWEFAHLQTGEPAERDMDGELMVKEETGLVFVLLPGGTFWMGAQSVDPGGQNFDSQAVPHEGPVHSVTLSPFFLSKYEMTQSQWSSFVGSNPSYYPAGQSSTKTLRITLLHPVEQVSWDTCELQLERLGLELPSEAQWEYACRAGTNTPWSTGETVESLRGYANIADEGSTDAYLAGWNFERGFSDGWDVHCPVGTLLPNAFGLHEMHGNVWEWCQDEFQAGSYRESPMKDPIAYASGSATRVDRGGGFFITAVLARSAFRDLAPPSFAGDSNGLRPARRITP